MDLKFTDPGINTSCVLRQQGAGWRHGPTHVTRPRGITRSYQVKTRTDALCDQRVMVEPQVQITAGPDPSRSRLQQDRNHGRTGPQQDRTMAGPDQSRSRLQQDRTTIGPDCSKTRSLQDQTTVDQTTAVLNHSRTGPQQDRVRAGPGQSVRRLVDEQKR